MNKIGGVMLENKLDRLRMKFSQRDCLAVPYPLINVVSIPSLIFHEEDNIGSLTAHLQALILNMNTPGFSLDCEMFDTRADKRWVRNAD